jgi:L-asparaginase II
MSDPVLVNVFRGRQVESRHHGAVAVLDADGEVLLALGDIDRPVFPRSAVKSIQALPLIESGAADRFGLTSAELALACSSHSGEPRHTEAAAGMLAKSGHDFTCLECGAHAPLAPEAAADLLRRGIDPTAIHNNCSGKHAGFVCLATALGADVAGYVGPGHPVQREVKAALENLTGVAHTDEIRGTDGCSIPTYAVPLRSLALAFARYGTGQGLGAARTEAAKRLRRAVAANPFMIAGTGRLDTRLTELFGERLFLKTGAEGVYCAALPEIGLGLAVKCDDGTKRAAEVILAALVARFLPLDAAGETALAPFVRPVLTNWRGIEVGSLAPADALAS